MFSLLNNIKLFSLIATHSKHEGWLWLLRETEKSFHYNWINFVFCLLRLCPFLTQFRIKLESKFRSFIKAGCGVLPNFERQLQDTLKRSWKIIFHLSFDLLSMHAHRRKKKHGTYIKNTTICFGQLTVSFRANLWQISSYHTWLSGVRRMRMMRWLAGWETWVSCFIYLHTVLWFK